MITTLLSAATEEGEDLNPLIPHTAEIILGLVVIGLLYFLINKLVVPNFEQAYAACTAAIEGGIE